MDVTALFYLPARVLLVAPVPCLFLLHRPYGCALHGQRVLNLLTARKGSVLRRWWRRSWRWLGEYEFLGVSPRAQRKQQVHAFPSTF